MMNFAAVAALVGCPPGVLANPDVASSGLVVENHRHGPYDAKRGLYDANRSLEELIASGFCLVDMAKDKEGNSVWHLFGEEASICGTLARTAYCFAGAAFEPGEAPRCKFAMVFDDCSRF